MRRPVPRWALIGAQAIGQLALVAVMPVLTRTVALDELAGFQIALSVGLMLLPLATLRAELFIPALVSDAECRRVVRIAFFVGAAVVLVLLFTSFLFGLLGAESASLGTLCAALVVIAYAVMAVDNANLIRRGETWRLSVRNLLSGVLGALLQLAAALVLPTAVTLSAAILAGRLFAVLLTMRGDSEARGTPAHTDREWTPLRAATAVSSAAVSTASAQILVVGAAAAAGVDAAAQMGIAQRAAAAPLGLLSQGVAQAAQSEIAPVVRSDTGRIRPVIVRNLRAILPISIVVTIGLFVGGPTLAVPVFGPGWEEAGRIIAALAVPSGLQLLAAPLLSVFVMLKREHLLLWLQVARLVLSLSMGSLVQFTTSDFLGAVIAFAIGNTVMYVVMFIVLLREISRFDSDRSR